MITPASITINGHVHIEDDLNTVHLDKGNAIHSQNFTRILARALASQPNSQIARMAFGNGGSVTDALEDVTLKTANDGLYPDPATWTSRLYNEIYSETIVTPNEATSAKNVNNPLQSTTTVTVTLAANEPAPYYLTAILPPQDILDNTFTFDEIGLFSPGISNEATRGRCDVDVRYDTIPTTDTGLLLDTTYEFKMTVDDVNIIVPTYTVYSVFFDSGTYSLPITYQDLVDAINVSISGSGASVTMEEPVTNTIDGHLKFISNTLGAGSNVLIDQINGDSPPLNYLFNPTNLPLFQETITYTIGNDPGLEDNPGDPSLERERLLTHITFVPVTKPANRTFVITYTISINIVLPN